MHADPTAFREDAISEADAIASADRIMFLRSKRSITIRQLDEPTADAHLHSRDSALELIGRWLDDGRAVTVDLP